VPKICHFFLIECDNWSKLYSMWYLQLIWTIAYWFHGILVEEFYQIKYNFYLNSSCDTKLTMLLEKSVQ
jgi:hypothetical protein